MEPIKISVITVAFNASRYIETTILSIINQTYSNIEYIIIDGGSTDGTVDIIKKYSNKISYWISEPDKGIYDAMNKGINKATGEWINFMNAGDTFHNPDTLSAVSEYLKNTSAEIVYGDVNHICEWGEKKCKPLPLNCIKHQMAFSHQSCFTNTKLMKQEKFSTKFKIANDYNFFYKQFIANKSFLYIPICIANYDTIYGISAKQHFLAIKENAYINGDIKTFKWKIQYTISFILFSLRKLIRTILPSNIVLKIKRYQNTKNI